jgi:hypothetical protein
LSADGSEAAPAEPVESATESGIRGELIPSRPGGFVKGHDPRRGISGGRPRKLRDIERMLNKEHRNTEKMREVFERLRSLAMGEVITVSHFNADNCTIETSIKLEADARFMQLYLDRVLGKARPVEEESPDFSDAPLAVLEYLVKKMKGG